MCINSESSELFKSMVTVDYPAEQLVRNTKTLGTLRNIGTLNFYTQNTLMKNSVCFTARTGLTEAN